MVLLNVRSSLVIPGRLSASGMLLLDDAPALLLWEKVDQGFVLLGVNHMKGCVTRGLLTKDVRSADGWQIGIDVFDHVQVRTSRLSYLSLRCLVKYVTSRTTRGSVRAAGAPSRA